MSSPIKIIPLLVLVFFILQSQAQSPSPPPTICIIGGGIGGSSLSHFLRLYSPPHSPSSASPIILFERHAFVGGRMATVSISGHTFEAGASILHPKNYHACNFTQLLNLKRRDPPKSENDFSLGIWDGNKFVFKTIRSGSKNPVVQKIVSYANSLHMLYRYGFSLFRMNSFVEGTVNKFLKYYESFETRPTFETVDGMLKWAGLHNLTTETLHNELVSLGLSPLLIQELVTVITRINYGQSVDISGLAGAVSLAGSGGGLWSIEGGNWQMASGLINISDVELHLNEEIHSISNLGDYYELNSTKVPERQLQHTHATFVRGLLNPKYFGLKDVSEIPELVGTVENPDLPFSSTSVLKQHSETDMSYKVFSRKALPDSMLDSIFSVRKETRRINWGAYPHYKAPEVFAPFILDGKHLYYVNAFENAASTMETSAVAAENVARLILSRLERKVPFRTSDEPLLHSDV